ncbi:MAG: mandelate racemase/muconate lactonizing enzyme family protein [Candidatus Latescibacteria bacterium]|nr:mandelate racemase/muconate lactonizing enzyme family protein [Candidatus Latescibacterota bacterium]
MKITDIVLLQLKVVEDLGTLEPAWSPGSEMRFQRGGGSVVEVHSDQGLVGIGPGVAPELLPTLKRYLVGEDPFDTERHLKVLRYYGRGMPYRGCAGVDIALWDLIGKACGQPLYKLWGGGKDRVPGYASMVQLSTPEERADLAARLHSEGWQAIKLRIHYETMAEDIATVAAVREAVGDGMTILVDANQAQSSGDWQPGILWDYRRALDTARELQALGCYWLEEPLPRYAFSDLARLNAEVDMAIAGGENNRGVHEFMQMLQDGVYDILQPEGMVNGGLTDLRKVGSLAEGFGKQVCPHHGGRQLGTVAHLHLVASWAHSPYLELLHDPPVGDYQNGFSALADPLVVEANGCVAVPQEPGLGIDIDRDLVE